MRIAPSFAEASAFAPRLARGLELVETAEATADKTEDRPAPRAWCPGTAWIKNARGSCAGVRQGLSWAAGRITAATNNGAWAGKAPRPAVPPPPPAGKARRPGRRRPSR